MLANFYEQNVKKYEVTEETIRNILEEYGRNERRLRQELKELLDEKQFDSFAEMIK